MKRLLKIAAIVFAVLLLVRVCLSNENKKDETNQFNSIFKPVNVSITTTITENTNPVNPNIFGVNIGFAFARELDKDSGFVQLLRAMHPATLRFPGGTVANFYHPNLPVYGFKLNELIGTGGLPLYNQQSKRSENILYNFIRLSKAVGSSAIFCANLLNGTVEETMFVLDELSKNNIPILGVELGNEFHLLPYRKDIFTSADVYIQKVKTTADAIHSKYPNIKIAVVGADVVEKNDNNARSKFMHNWNQTLSQQNFYDAYVWHYYAGCNTCDNNKYFDSLYLLNLQQLAPYKTNKIYNIVNDFVKIYGTNKKLWLTEWNIANGKFLDNTFTQGAFVYEQFLEIININSKYNDYIELTNLHSIDGLVNNYKGKMKPILSENGNQATVQYFAFKFLATTLDTTVCRATEKISCNDKVVENNFVCNAFYKKDTKTNYLHFINRTGKPIELNINTTTKNNFKIVAVDAKVPYATAGKTAYEKDYPNKLTPIQLREEISDKNIISIAPFSFGYIEYQTK